MGRSGWMWISAALVASTYPSLPAQTLAAATSVAYGSYETRDFIAQNGRQISVSSFGNLVSLETPFGFEHINRSSRAREGYVISYINPFTSQQRVLYDVHDLYSAVLARRDFVPVSFTGPANGTPFSVTTPIIIFAVVDTADGLLRLTNRIEWVAGSGEVTIRTTVTNRVSVPVAVRFVKRHVDLNPDGSGAFGGNLYSDWVRLPGVSTGGSTIGGIGAFERCVGCKPGPGPPPLTIANVALHSISFMGSPNPAYATIHTDSDTSELHTAGPALSTNLTGLRTNENNQATLVWIGSTLGPSASQSFIAQYRVE